MGKIRTMNHRSDVHDNYQVYQKWLDKIMADDTLHNIAMLGIRGAGKSSIIHSYDSVKHQERGETYLYISLADFEEGHVPAVNHEDIAKISPGTGGKKKSGKTASTSKKKKNAAAPMREPARTLTAEEKERLQKRLEYNLLCQILARCTKEDLRGTVLQAIPEIRTSQRMLWLKYLYLFISGLLLVGLIYEERFSAVLRVWMVPEPTRILIHSIGYLLAFALLFVGACYAFSRKPGAFRLGKVSLKASVAEAEVVPSEQDYCLDRFKFELVHILSQIADKIDYVVVIEDMELVEEYRCLQIMSKLRELNNLVNTHRRELYRRHLYRSLRWKLSQRKATLDEKKEQRATPDEKKEQKVPTANRLFQRKATADKKRKQKDRRAAQWENWKKPVRFVYAMSDGTLDTDERTKFFDTIIPVVPALNHQNAYDTLKNDFTGALQTALEETDSLIAKMASTVTDYRTENDIYTEYAFFKDLYEQNHKSIHGEEPGKTKKPQTAEEIKEESLRNRKLCALAVYKCLFPWEFHYAFTPSGQGILPIPDAHRPNGKRYDSTAIALVEFLIDEGYLDQKSLTLVGYSRAALERQWLEILTTGGIEERKDLLNRFNAINRGRETSPEDFTIVVKAAASQVMKHNTDDAVSMQLTKHMYPDAKTAVKRYYEMICVKELAPTSLLNLMSGLLAFWEELPNALSTVNLVDGEIVGKQNFQGELKRHLRSRRLQKMCREDKAFKTRLLGAEDTPSECLMVMARLLEMEPEEVREYILHGEKVGVSAVVTALGFSN